MTQAQKLSAMYDGTRKTSDKIEGLAQSLAVKSEEREHGFDYIFADGSMLDQSGYARKLRNDDHAEPRYELDPAPKRRP